MVLSFVSFLEAEHGPAFILAELDVGQHKAAPVQQLGHVLQIAARSDALGLGLALGFAFHDLITSTRSPSWNLANSSWLASRS
jgi:hypothetical protein